MRATILAIAVLLIVIPRAASAQCPSSAGVTCHPARQLNFGPARQLDFGLGTSRKKATLQIVSSAPAVPPVMASDCKMVKHIDPQFVSIMPIIAPDPNVQLPMQIVRVPPCKD